MTQASANLSFSVIAITSPITGSLLSGIVTNKAGGYETNDVLQTVFFIGILAMISSALMPLVSSYQLALALTWITFFLGAICLPIITGAFLNRVNESDRPKAISLAYLSYNLLGYLPAPLVYGLANEISGDSKSRMGMIVLMYT